MTFNQFNTLVKKYCPNVYQATCHTDAHGGNKVIVSFKENGRGYLFSGSYMHILGKLGMNYISQRTIEFINNRINQLQYEVDNGITFTLFAGAKDNELKRKKEEIESCKKELSNCIGYVILDDDSGKELGIYEG